MTRHCSFGGCQALRMSRFSHCPRGTAIAQSLTSTENAGKRCRWAG
jgi:hypothetical protein